MTVIRYEPTYDVAYEYLGMMPDENGDYVSYEDYESAVKGRNEALDEAINAAKVYLRTQSRATSSAARAIISAIEALKDVDKRYQT